jgi:hypothetical protein
MEEEEEEECGVDDDAGSGTTALVEGDDGCGGTVCVRERFLLIESSHQQSVRKREGGMNEVQGRERERPVQAHGRKMKRK